MIKFLLLTLSMFLFFGSLDDAKVVDNSVEKFYISELSLNGQKAYKNLLKAERFEVGLVGRGGILSQYVKDFGAILREKNADSAFKELIKNGTLTAKLYGLNGLYFTDYNHFKIEIKNFANNEEMVQTIEGCVLSEQKVSEIVLSKNEYVAIINPKKTFEDFAKENNKVYVLDIANGGYPATIKSFVK